MMTVDQQPVIFHTQFGGNHFILLILALSWLGFQKLLPRGSGQFLLCRVVSIQNKTTIDSERVQTRRDYCLL